MSGIRCRSCARLQFANDPVDDNPIVCLRCAEEMRDVWSAGLRSDVTALRAENKRLIAALREIDARTGHFGEAPPPPEWMPMLSLIAWVGKTARAALAEVGE